jgi:hypothetical protein
MKIVDQLIGLFALLGLAVSAQAGDFAVSAPAVSGYDVQEHLEMFQKNSQRYVPVYGGYCAFGVSKGKKFIGDPEVWRIVDNRLYFNLDARIQDDWLKDIPGYIATAELLRPTLTGRRSRTKIPRHSKLAG